MHRLLLAPVLLLGGLLASCTTVEVSQPTLERELAAVKEQQRLDRVARRVLHFRDGLMKEALDRGRIDRVERAEAAAWGMARLREELAAIHRDRLDNEGRIDLDVAGWLLDASEEYMRVATLDDRRLGQLAAPASELSRLAAAGPPDEDVIEMLDAGAMWLLHKDYSPRKGAKSRDYRHAAARMRQAARLLRQRGNESAVLDSKRGPGALKNARAAAKKFDALAKRCDDMAKKASGAMAEPLGREGFVARLRSQHGVDASPEAIAGWGRQLLDRTLGELDALAETHWPGMTWKQAIEVVRDDHATASDMPSEAFQAAIDARDFCIERGLMTIPPPAAIAHIELVGDNMAKSYPFAAYSWRRSTPHGESGRYMVSPGATWMTPEQTRERLRGNCRAWTRVVAPHEAWPGHHLQFWYADEYSTPLRREASTPVLVEGWGLYCEWLLDRHGYFKTPGERLALLTMRAWRASRVVLDVGLHTGKFTPKEGIEFLMENAALTRDAATAEITRYMRSPTQPFSYAWGWNALLELRRQEEERLGEAFDEREFHDRLLKAGPLPIRFLRRTFGYDLPEGDAAL
ncbi:MAG: DUF885 domain-containing protein [Planctomycetota bacterium]|jgi:uncharacterized protein (DUF885 family)